MRTAGRIALLVLCTASCAHGKSFVVELTPGDSHERTIESTGDALVVTIEERGIDVDATAVVADRTYRAYDGDTLRHGTHRVLVDPGGGSARLRIVTSRPGARAGRVAIDVAARPSLTHLEQLEAAATNRFRDPATAADAETVRAATAWVEHSAAANAQADHIRAALLLDRVLAGRAERAHAIAVLERVLPVLREAERPRELAGALNNIGMHRFRMGDGRLARAPLEEALAIARAIGDTLLEAVIQNNLCLTTASRGDADGAVACYGRAMALSLESGDAPRTATAHNNLGHALSSAGRAGDAMLEFERAIALRESIGDRAGQGDPLGNLGLELQTLRRYDEAEAMFVRAEAVYREARNDDGLSVALRHRGQLRLLLGDYAQAREWLEAAVAIDRARGKRRDLIVALTRLGEAQALDRKDEGIPPALLEADSLVRIDGDRAAMSDVALRLARAANDLGRWHEAEAHARRAAEWAAEVRDERLRGLAELERARAQLGTRRDATALATAEGAARRLEQSGGGLAYGTALAVAGAARQRSGQFDAAVALLDRASAIIDESRSAIADSETRARFFAARRFVHERHVVALVGRARGTDDPAALRDALAVSDTHRSRSVAERLLGAARRAARSEDVSPSRGALARWPAGTTLLHFLVADERSLAFVVRAGTIRVVDLPGRSELERWAAAISDAAASGRAFDASAAEFCARVWLGLAAGAIDERVAIVADASMHRIPWAALPCGPGDLPLLEQHEFTTLASLRAWAATAREPRRFERALAVVDPVYQRDDVRITGTAAGVSPPALEAANLLRGSGLQRLASSARDTRVLERELEPGKLVVLSSHEANIDATVAQLARTLDLVHFGTHGVASERDFDESGLVLSLFDATGRARPGFLSAATIAAQNLDVQLVVLAACDSAGGAIVTGEPAMGSAYAFSLAGARYVLAATWPVSDRATSLLMDAFYRRLVVDGASPAAALRAAQRELRATPRLAQPRHWAAFQLAGAHGG